MATKLCERCTATDCPIAPKITAEESTHCPFFTADNAEDFMVYADGVDFIHKLREEGFFSEHPQAAEIRKKVKQ
jgi:hypothetical protein